MTAAAGISGAPTSADPVGVLRQSWGRVSAAYAEYLTAMVGVGHAEGQSPGWETAEIAAALTFTTRRAEYEYEFAEVLVLRLPLVLSALRSGHLDHHKARVFAEYLAHLEDQQIERICTRLVPRAHRWTTGQLAARLLREVQAIDPAYTRRRYQRALRERGVYGYLAPDGTATITAHGLTPGEAAAAADRLDRLAAAARRAGHPGSIHQIRADLFVRLLDGRYNGFTAEQIVTALLADPTTFPEPAGNDLEDDHGSTGPADGDATAGDDRGGRRDTDDCRDGDDPSRVPQTDESDRRAGADADDGHRSGETGPSLPADQPRHGVEVRIGLATLLGLDDHPAELPGWGPIVAEEARLLLARQHPAEWIFAITDAAGYLRHGGLIRARPIAEAPGAGCRGGTVEIHSTAELLADLACRPDLPVAWAPVIADIARRHTTWCARSGDPDSYLDQHPEARHPRADLRRHIRLRDRTCVAPGCRRPARAADQDHTHDHARGGRSTRANLAPLCDLHHAMKHEGGWHLDQPEPGRFTWRSPLGRTYRTRGAPVVPDLPEPVPRMHEDDHDPAGARTYDGPIFPLARRPRSSPEAERPPPAARDRATSMTPSPSEPAADDRADHR